MNQKLLTTVALLSASLLAGAAYAGPVNVVGTGTFSDTTTGNGVTFSANDSPIDLENMVVGVAVPVTDFITIQITQTDPNNNATDDIMESFAFTLPTTGDGAISGTGRIDGVSENGKISWAGPATVQFGDGSALLISLSDTNYQDQTADVDATFTLTKGPTTPVPEPASLALLGTGMVGLGLFRRRTKRPTA